MLAVMFGYSSVGLDHLCTRQKHQYIEHKKFEGIYLTTMRFFGVRSLINSQYPWQSRDSSSNHKISNFEGQTVFAHVFNWTYVKHLYNHRSACGQVNFNNFLLLSHHKTVQLNQTVRSTLIWGKSEKNKNRMIAIFKDKS